MFSNFQMHPSNEIWINGIHYLYLHSNNRGYRSSNISTVHEGYLSKFPSLLKSAVDKVMGLLDRRQNIVYLDLNQPTSRKNFIKLHEAGHKVLPWQQGICEILEDTDDTLSPHVREEFEQRPIFLPL